MSLRQYEFSEKSEAIFGILLRILSIFINNQKFRISWLCKSGITFFIGIDFIVNIISAWFFSNLKIHLIDIFFLIVLEIFFVPLCLFNWDTYIYFISKTFIYIRSYLRLMVFLNAFFKECFFLCIVLQKHINDLTKYHHLSSKNKTLF